VTNVELVSRKLAALIEFSKRARRRGAVSAEAVASDPERQDALGMALLVAIQEAIDLAFHIVADERWGSPGSYAEGFAILEQHGVITAELAQAMTNATGLRNRLAHGYASIDVPRLLAGLPQGLDALDAFARAIGAFAGS
jgi:uncharacterized protein YutE (UPF0331/DUF86 family)